LRAIESLLEGDAVGNELLCGAGDMGLECTAGGQPSLHLRPVCALGHGEAEGVSDGVHLFDGEADFEHELHGELSG
jgi:hypothetical protein